MARPEARRVAVLGAGILGSCTALMLARRGVPVVLFDAAEAPMQGASRWNEGKIHLGHLYAADPSLATARLVLPGGLAFAPLMQDLLGESLEPATTRSHDTYLVHRQSVVDVDAMAAYLTAVTEMAAAHPRAGDYLAPLHANDTTRLGRAELEAHCATDRVLAGFRVPERSVETQWLADRLVAALAAEPRIDMRLLTRVRSIRRQTASDPITVLTPDGDEGPFDFVVNGTWESRLGIDAGLDLPPPQEHNHRYRVSVFLATQRTFTLPSTVLATGPFGDVKNYDGRHFYLSWYPHGLQAEGNDLVPPPTPRLDAARREAIRARIAGELCGYLHGLGEVVADATQVRTEGGWVYASGSGSLADRSATLHRRDRAGIVRSGNYFTVDTGKYSIAPWLAREVANEILAT